MKTKHLFATVLIVGLTIFALSIFVNFGDADPARDEESGCDRVSPCHDKNAGGGRDTYNDITVEASPQDSQTPEVIQISITQADGENKWTGLRSAEASQKGNGDVGDPVYASFVNGDEDSKLDISAWVDNGTIEDGQTIKIWAGYKDDGQDTWHFDDVLYTYDAPNNPPVADAGLALNEDDEPVSDLTAILNNDNEVTVFFNGSGCSDPDDDTITKYQWDLDNDGTFSENGDDEGDGDTNEIIFSRVFKDTDVGEYTFKFRCSDGEMFSDALEITLEVKEPPKLPDLGVESHEISNNDDTASYYEQGDTVDADLTVKNFGNKDLQSDYVTHFSYAYRATQDDPWGDWELVEAITREHDSDNDLPAASTEILTFQWYTGDEGEGAADFGYYKFQFKLDPADDIVERREDTGEDEPNVVESDQIELKEKYVEGTPDFSLDNFVSPAEVEPDASVSMSIDVINSGDGDGSVKLLLFVDGSEDMVIKRFTVEAGETVNKPFSWNALAGSGTHTLQIQVDYKGDIVDISDENSILIKDAGSSDDEDGDGLPDWWELNYWNPIETYDGNADPDNDGRNNLQEKIDGTNPVIPDEAPTNDDDDDSPGFIAGMVIVGVVAAAVVMRRKR